MSCIPQDLLKSPVTASDKGNSFMAQSITQLYEHCYQWGFQSRLQVLMLLWTKPHTFPLFKFIFHVVLLRETHINSGSTPFSAGQGRQTAPRDTTTLWRRRRTTGTCHSGCRRRQTINPDQGVRSFRFVLKAFPHHANVGCRIVKSLTHNTRGCIALSNQRHGGACEQGAEHKTWFHMWSPNEGDSFPAECSRKSDVTKAKEVDSQT